MMIKYFLRLSILLSVALHGAAFGQCKGDILKYTSQSKKAIKCFEMSQVFINNKDNEHAVEKLKQAIEYDNNFVEAWLVLGGVYTDMNLIDKAEDSYKQAIRINPEFNCASYYFLATVQFNAYKYAEAKENYVTYVGCPNIYEEDKALALRNIRNCDFAIEALKNPVPFKPQNLGSAINTEFHEYHPCLTVDQSQLIFTRNIKDERTFDGFNEDLYISYKDDSSRWNEAVNMGTPINSLVYEGASTLSSDGQIMILAIACDYSGNYGPGRKGFGSCDLFISFKQGNKWSNPANMGSPINTPNFESQPSLAPDGKTLYFVRGYSRGKNIARQDIYVSKYIGDGRWSKPESISNKINTPFEEESVFIHPDGKTLYFASNGHPGMGGLDLFMSRKDSLGQWSNPVNLGYPINTVKDERSLFVTADGKKAYFASEREGGFGNLDLYYFDMPENIKPIAVSYMKGRVYNADTKAPLYVDFELTDLKTDSIVMRANSDKITGEFLVSIPANKDYALNVSADGYLFYSDHFSFNKSGTLADPFTRDVPLKPIKEGQTIVLKNIFFDTDKFELKKESVTELNRLYEMLTENPAIKIEISGHTDDRADDQYNQKLSENRAKAVYDLLITKGIAKERLAYIGYGEKKPLTSNDTEEGRAINRRTELKITSLK